MRIIGRPRNGFSTVFCVLSLATFLCPPAVHGQQVAPPPPTIDCAGKCATSITADKKDEATIKIDANSGRILEGSTRLRQETKLRMVVINENPFKYVYRIEITSQPIEAAIASSFLSLIPGFGDILKQLGGTQEFVKTESEKVAKGTACPGAAADEWKKAWDSATESAKALAEQSKSLKAALDAKAKISDDYEQFQKDTDRESLAEKDCPSLCGRADKLRGDLPQLSETDELTKQLDQYKKAVTSLETAVQSIKGTADATCLDNAKSDLESIQKALEAGKQFQTKTDEALQKLTANKKSFESFRAILETAVGRDHLTWEERFPQTTDGAREVRINVYRRNLRVEGAAEQTVATLTVQVGESVLALSGGIGFSTIGDRRVVRVASLVPVDPTDPTKGTTLGQRFGFEQNSKFKPSGVVILNANLWSLEGHPGVKFGPCTGLVISNRAGGTQVEFIAGGSVALHRNTIYLNFGFHAAQEEDIAGGFNINDVVPATLTDPLPVQKNWKSGFMFAITYKIR